MIKYIAILFVMVIALPYCAFALTNGNFETSAIGVQPANWSGYSLTLFTTGGGARTGGAGTKIGVGYNASGAGSIYQTETGVPLTGYPAQWHVEGWVRLVDNATNFNFGWFGSAPPYGPSSHNISTAPTLGVWTSLVVIHTWSAPSTYTDGWRDVQVNFTGVIQLDDFHADVGVPVTLSRFKAGAGSQDWCLE